MFLTDEQKVNLTGYKRPKFQARWLKANGYKFRLNASGRPVVLESEVQRDLSDPQAAAANTPNFDHFQKTG